MKTHWRKTRPEGEDGDYIVPEDEISEEEMEEQEYEEAQQKRRNRIIMIAIGAGCALFLIIGIWMLTRDSVDDRTDTLPTLLPQVTATETPVPSPSAEASDNLPTPDPSTGLQAHRDRQPLVDGRYLDKGQQ